jgi:excisionase family DNA binding protein
VKEMSVPKLFTIKQVAEVTGLQPWRVYELIAQGKGPRSMRLGRTIRVPESALVAWIDEGLEKQDQEEAEAAREEAES